MSLSKEQLTDLSNRIYMRLNEFGDGLIDLPSEGVVRVCHDEIVDWQDEQEQKEVAAYNQGYEEGYSAGMTVNAATVAVSNVHGETGAVIAKVGTIGVRNHGDGTAEFDHEGTPIHFRITLDDDEANMDRYCRGFMDGVYHAREQEPPADDAEPEPQSPSFVVDPEWESKGIICGDDPDDVGVGARMKIAVPSDDDDPEPPDTGLWAGNAEPVADSFGQAFSGDDAEPAPAVSQQAVATLGPEHTTLTPLKPIGRPRTLAEVDADATLRGGMSDEVASLRMGTEERAAELRDILVELQVMSSDGQAMPTMAEWDKNRPNGMRKAQALLIRHGLTWNALAERARLKLKRSA